MSNDSFGPKLGYCPSHRVYRRGYLPHIDAPWHPQMVTWRLEDALPESVRRRMRSESGRHPRRGSELAMADPWLDAGHGECILQDPVNAQLVLDTLLHDTGRRYLLMAWVVMPNHVHVVVKPYATQPLSRIIGTWKSVSAHRIQKRRGRRGRLWQRGYFDRLIRNDRHLAQTVLYIENNPVRAGLVDTPEDWPWSSAQEDLDQAT